MYNFIFPMNRSKKFVIITAGGSGKRMGASVPKQMLEIGGKPILRYTIEKFLNLPFDVDIIVVINAEAKEMWKDYCRESGFIFKHILIEGGMTRFHSVKKALKYITPGSIVAVHDGVRPFISKATLISMFELSEENEAVIPSLNAVESMRERFSDGSTSIVDRDRFMMIQTPQIFHSDVLLESYKQAYLPIFTDDASVVEKAGHHLTFCDGDRLNIKITTPEDMMLSEALMKISVSD